MADAFGEDTTGWTPAEEYLTEQEDGGWHRGDWMQTITGKRFYPLSPRMEDIHFLDIGHALGMLCRYNGHVDRFYSVAEHSVLMSFVMPTPELALEALIHDASEAYLGDMIRPLKHSGAMGSYKEIELNVEVAIWQRYGLEVHPTFGPVKSAEVKEADTRILLTERNALMPKHDDWVQDGTVEPLDIAIQAWEPAEASNRWLARFADLRVQLNPPKAVGQ